MGWQRPPRHKEGDEGVAADRARRRKRMVPVMDNDLTKRAESQDADGTVDDVLPEHFV